MSSKNKVFISFLTILSLVSIIFLVLYNKNYIKSKSLDVFNLFDNKNFISEKEKDSNITCIFVSNDGDDNSSGKKDRPYKTLEKALSTANNLIKDNSCKNEIVIFLREGTYNFENTLEFNSETTGNEKIKLSIEGYNDEKIYFTGNTILDNSQISKAIDVSSKEIINKLSPLSSNEILVTSLKNISIENNSDSLSTSPELFINDNVMTLSRYPNYDFLTVDKVIENFTNSSGSSKYVFTTTRLSPYTWSSNNIYVNGYLGSEWSFSSTKLASIDKSNSQISISENILYGVTKGSRFYFSNILEEVDAPNEYYIDYDNNLLYFIPPDDIDNLNDCKIEISTYDKPFININSSNNISFKNIIFQGTRNTAINISSSKNICIDSCTFRNLSYNGIDIKSSENINITNSTLYNIGNIPIRISAGDRNSLISCNITASNNTIHDFGRIIKSYAPAIFIYGVGITASNNTIYNGPHLGIFFGGNDNIIEYNEIYNIALETGDVGAIYSGRDWTSRGNVIRYNYIHDSNNDYSEYGVSGIYFDDCMSSAEVYGNILYKLGKGIYGGGGRDFNIYNNMFIDCDTSIRFDGRGEDKTTATYSSLLNSLTIVPYTEEPWKSKYPELYTILNDDNPGIPKNNIITNNLIYNSSDLLLSNLVIEYGEVNNNILYVSDPGFKNYDSNNFTLKKNSKVFDDINFENIDQSLIGVQK